MYIVFVAYNYFLLFLLTFKLMFVSINGPNSLFYYFSICFLSVFKL